MIYHRMGIQVALGLAHSEVSLAIGHTPTGHGLLGINTHEVAAVLRMPLRMINLVLALNAGYG
jgi:hypothetical protein